MPKVIKGQNSWFIPGQVSKSLPCLTNTQARAMVIQVIFQNPFHPLYSTGQPDLYLITFPRLFAVHGNERTAHRASISFSGYRLSRVRGINQMAIDQS